MLLMTKKHNW